MINENATIVRVTNGYYLNIVMHSHVALIVQVPRKHTVVFGDMYDFAAIDSFCRVFFLCETPTQVLVLIEVLFFVRQLNICCITHAGKIRAMMI